MLSPIRTVLMHYPNRSFFTILIIIIVATTFFSLIRKRYIKGIISKKEGVIHLLRIYYVIALLFFTVIGRRSWNYYRYNFDFGYSYQEVFLLGDYTLASQIIANILAFVPIGILCFLTAKKYSLLNSFLYGFSLSLFIEVMQLVLRRGYFEFDDMLSNTIGVLIGYIVGKILANCVKISFKGQNYKN